jgi:hypothetical protein
MSNTTEQQLAQLQARVSELEALLLLTTAEMLMHRADKFGGSSKSSGVPGYLPEAAKYRKALLPHFAAAHIRLAQQSSVLD